jgi:D-tyrosyl-tRNA(Tyr) deacylase
MISFVQIIEDKLMRAIVQRIKEGQVIVNNNVVGAAGKGFMVLVGFNHEDVTDSNGAAYIMDKLLNLRIFEDLEGKMNLSIQDVEGDLLIVPNFTLYGDCRKGRRPSFSNSAPASNAERLFEDFVKQLKIAYPKVETGEFQADMLVHIVNDGPVTMILDSDRLL